MFLREMEHVLGKEASTSCWADGWVNVELRGAERSEAVAVDRLELRPLPASGCERLPYGRSRNRHLS